MESHSKTPPDSLSDSELQALCRNINRRDPDTFRGLALDLAGDADPAMRAEMERLFMATIASAGSGDAARSESITLPAMGGDTFGAGDRCGPYLIERELSRGGMGEVYLATRADDLKLKVALKTLNHVHPQSRALFEKECRLLSGLRHANIAHLIDAGILPVGRPWLAMELVEGHTLDVWLVQRNPDLNDRIKLFLKICEAVSHAHRQMIIHRDIKPGNILVQANGEPKLLDFGIAARLNPDTGRESTLTLPATGMMTPQYASPEQVSGLRLTAASDVYSLGVLLYEMFTGIRPYQLRTGNPLGMIRQINEASITPPAAVIPSTPDGGVLGQFATRLRGDLDTIVLKALERDIPRRYAGVAELAEDLNRYLHGFPIRARPATAGYRIGKFIERHRWPLFLSSGLALGLLFFAVFAWQQRANVMRERDRVVQERKAAEDVGEFMVSMFERSQPKYEREEVTALDVMEQGRRQLVTGLTGQVETRHRLLTTMGRVYRALGNYTVSRQLLERAIAEKGQQRSWDTVLELVQTLHVDGDYNLAQQHLDYLQQASDEDDDPVRHMRLQHAVARQWHLRGNLIQSAELYERAAELQEVLTPEQQAAFRKDRISLWSARAEHDRAIQALDALLILNHRLYGTEHSEIAATLLLLGEQYQKMGAYEKAARYYQDSESMTRTLFGPNHPSLVPVYLFRARLYIQRARVGQARDMLNRALTLSRETLGTDHLLYAECLSMMAQQFMMDAQLEQAEQTVRKVLAIKKRVLGDQHPTVVNEVYNLGKIFLFNGRVDPAEVLIRDALRTQVTLLGKDHPNVALVMSTLGVVYQKKGDFQQAESLLRQALDKKIKTYGDIHPSVAESYHQMGALFNEQGLYADAERWFRQGMEMQIKIYGKAHPILAESYNSLAMVYHGQGNYRAAEPLYRQSFDINARVLGENHPGITSAINNLGVALKDMGDFAAAEPLLQRALQINLDTVGPDHYYSAIQFHNLAEIFDRKGDYPEAEVYFRRAIGIVGELFVDRYLGATILSFSYARLLAKTGDTSEAEALFRKTGEQFREILGDEHLRLFRWHLAYGRMQLRLGDSDRAGVHLNKALTMGLTLFGERHPDLVPVYCLLADISSLKQAFEEAGSLLEKAETIAAAKQNPHHLDDVLFHKGQRLRLAGERNAAEAPLRQALTSRSQVLGPDHPKVAHVQLVLAELLTETGRANEALPLIKAAAAIYAYAFPEEHEIHQTVLSVKGLILVRLDRDDEGRILLRRAARALSARFDSDHWRVQAAQKRLRQAASKQAP